MKRVVESRSLSSVPMLLTRSISVRVDKELQKRLFLPLVVGKPLVIWLIDRTHIDSTVKHDVIVDVDTLVLSLPPHALRFKEQIALMRRLSAALRGSYGVDSSAWQTTAGLAVQGDDVFVAARIDVSVKHGEKMEDIGGIAVAEQLVEVLTNRNSEKDVRPASSVVHREASKLLDSLPKAQKASIDIVAGSERIAMDGELVPAPAPAETKDAWSGTAMVDGFHRRNHVAWLQPTDTNALWEASYDEAMLHESIRQVAGTDVVVSVQLTVFRAHGKIIRRVIDHVGPHLLSDGT